MPERTTASDNADQFNLDKTCRPKTASFITVYIEFDFYNGFSADEPVSLIVAVSTTCSSSRKKGD
jgi:hypothetical protein